MPTRETTRNPSAPEFSDTPTFEAKEYEPKRTDVLSAVDWLGNRFHVGDTVMYCIGAGRGQMMALGTVQAMRAQECQELVSWDWEGNKRVNEVRRDYWNVEVQVLTERTSGSWDNEKRTRPAWVNPMNITLWERSTT